MSTEGYAARKHSSRRAGQRRRRRISALILCLFLAVGIYAVYQEFSDRAGGGNGGDAQTTETLAEKVSHLIGGIGQSAGADEAGGENGEAVHKDGEWYLILVNQSNKLPDDYEVELIDLSNGEQVDRRIYPALQEMFDDARAEGIYPVVGSGYRTSEEQQSLLDAKIREYENQGESDSRAEKLAKEWVAEPGYSEHELGMAVDINANKDRSGSDEVYQWMFDNSYRYGFIQRYPADKTEKTGTIYEPWHFRYVGKEAAGEIHEQGICLEEYLEQ